MHWPRVIFHLDMDAFYAAIEQRDDPSLRGKPVIVGGTSSRGVVSTCSYEARVFGVRSAMPMFEARRRCPDGIFVPGRMSAYVEASKQMMAILGDYAPDVEPLSLDEAFMDMTGTENLLGKPEDIAARLMEDIRSKLRLTASVGVATSKYIAKVASDFKKPDGLTVVLPGSERAFLAPLPISRIWGVGPKTTPRLEALGLRTIGDVAARSLEEVKALVGQGLGEHIWRLSNAQDIRSVKRERRAKSMGAERTLSRNISGRAAVHAVLLPLCDEVAARLRKASYRAKGVRLKVKYADFTTMTRQVKLEEPVYDAESISLTLDELYTRVDIDRPMRLVGLAAFDLVPQGAYVQPALFGKREREDSLEIREVERTRRTRRERLEQTLDSVKAKFGDDAVRRASGRAVAALNPSDHYRED